MLVISGSGLLGSAIYRYLGKHDAPCTATSRQELPGMLAYDLANPDLSVLNSVTDKVAVVCAAVTKLQDCEAEPDRTHNINVVGTLKTLRALADKGMTGVFVSSTQVFDGETPFPDESAKLNPRNVYGCQKAEVETAIEQEGLPFAIFRTGKILGTESLGMFEKWVGMLQRGEKVQAATNLALAPVLAEDTAHILVRLATERLQGIWHYAPTDAMSYFEAAKLLASIAGSDPSLVEAQVLTTDQVPRV